MRTRSPLSARVLLLLSALLLAPSVLDAQVCRTGKPCGNTCIARNRTCRVGPGTARSAPTTAPPRTRTPATRPPDAGFVASSRGRVFYSLAQSCSAWRSLSAANLRWFRSEAEARAAGYTPSQSRGCGPSTASPTGPALAQPPSSFPAVVDAEAACTVSNVVDGDTLDCADGRRIRLLLVDAPEMDQGPFGEVAKTFLEGLTPTGSVLRVETDVELQDGYNRLLAYLRTAEGELVNEQLVRMGVAIVSVYPPNVRYVEPFRAAEEEARAQRRGLWAVNAFACTPADHRAGRC